MRIAVPVLVAEPGGAAWTGESADLSPLGIKVRDGRVAPASIVRLEFEIPERVPTLSVSSFTVRDDPDGVAFSFIDLRRPAFLLLRGAVDWFLLSRELGIAIVASDADLAGLLTDYVAAHGHTPVVLPSAEEALAYLRHDRPDALLVDLNLPGMGGLEFLETLTARGMRFPVLAVTTSGATGEARRCLDLGALDVVAKPLDAGQLDLTLQALAFKGLESRVADVEPGLGA